MHTICRCLPIILFFISSCRSLPERPSIHRGTVLFELMAEGEENYELCGSWNEWQRKVHFMNRLGRYRYLELELEPGVYEFVFYKDGLNPFLPEHLKERVPDGFGGENGLVYVP
ncbi:MAG: glycogen-binding domain-containing protein [Leptospiraceae bacterium]|nr:glycogen-binding domain-containing protein [Leptospiraceae bacterium]MDW8305931.1 glycogen-binding domain-containing protein [Leptospiraceae bacterium]